MTSDSKNKAKNTTKTKSSTHNVVNVNSEDSTGSSSSPSKLSSYLDICLSFISLGMVLIILCVVIFVLILFRGNSFSSIPSESAIWRHGKHQVPMDNRCKKYYPELFAGPEGLELDFQSNILFISSDPRIFASPHTKTHLKSDRGKIAALLLNHPDLPPKDLTHDLNFPNGFHPHGISSFRQVEINTDPTSTGETGRKTSFRLFVVGHPDPSLAKNGVLDTIFVFDLIPKSRIHFSLKLVGNYSDPSMVVSPNDVAAVSPTEFFVTNDHATNRARHPILHAIEDFLPLKQSFISFFDGYDYHRVDLPGMDFANGITYLGNDLVVITQTMSGMVSLYYFDRTSEIPGKLVLLDTKVLPTGVDNVHKDEGGGFIYIAGSPRPLEFLAHAIDHRKTSKSDVWRIGYDADGKDPKDVRFETPQRILYDTGKMISASSSAVKQGNSLYIGTVFDGFYKCVV